MIKEEHISEWSYDMILRVSVLILVTRQFGFVRIDPYQTKKEVLRGYITRFRKAHPDKYVAIMAKIRLGIT